MHPDIAESERLVVFIFDSDDLKEDGAHWKAFMPGKHDGERSLYRVDGLDFREVAAIGQELASLRATQKLRGWAVISASHVRALPGLQLKAAEPPERHGVIESWPLEKNDKRSLAQSLASVAATIRFPFAP
jgi:hypothetical protein